MNLTEEITHHLTLNHAGLCAADLFKICKSAETSGDIAKALSQKYQSGGFTREMRPNPHRSNKSVNDQVYFYQIKGNETVNNIEMAQARLEKTTDTQIIEGLERTIAKLSELNHVLAEKVAGQALELESVARCVQSEQALENSNATLGQQIIQLEAQLEAAKSMPPAAAMYAAPLHIDPTDQYWNEPNSPKLAQIGGNHYLNMAIQPIEFIMANQLGYCEANVLKYISRYKAKNGVQDLQKARHYIDLLIEAQ